MRALLAITATFFIFSSQDVNAQVSDSLKKKVRHPPTMVGFDVTALKFFGNDIIDNSLRISFRVSDIKIPLTGKIPLINLCTVQVGGFLKTYNSPPLSSFKDTKIGQYHFGIGPVCYPLKNIGLGASYIRLDNTTFGNPDSISSGGYYTDVAAELFLNLGGILKLRKIDTHCKFQKALKVFRETTGINDIRMVCSLYEKKSGLGLEFEQKRTVRGIFQSAYDPFWSSKITANLKLMTISSFITPVSLNFQGFVGQESVIDPNRKSDSSKEGTSPNINVFQFGFGLSLSSPARK